MLFGLDCYAYAYGHSRAGFTGLAGQMRPAGRQLDNAAVANHVASCSCHAVAYKVVTSCMMSRCHACKS